MTNKADLTGPPAQSVLLIKMRTTSKTNSCSFLLPTKGK